MINLNMKRIFYFGLIVGFTTNFQVVRGYENILEGVQFFFLVEIWLKIDFFWSETDQSNFFGLKYG